MIEKKVEIHTQNFDIGEYDFESGATVCEIKFSGADNTALVTIFSDGTPIGVCALSNGKHPEIIRFEIDKTSGKHNLTITSDRPVLIYTIRFDNDEIYPGLSYTPITKIEDNGADTWEATDMLGRKIASVEDVRAKKDRRVGIFYWSWRDLHTPLRPVNVVETLSKYPAAEFNENHPAWGDRRIQCHWNEPLYGYYRNDDPYIIRRHAVMLADAGIDMIMFDCTNTALLWRSAYEAILKGFYEAKKDGIKTPQVAFMLNFGPLPETESMLRALYQNLYRPGLYEDMWFKVDGKPLIMAYPEALPKEGKCEADTKILNEIRNFFTFRPGQPMYAGGPWRNDQWGWLEIFPQNKYVVRDDGSCEMMVVGVGQNAREGRICTYFNDEGTFGRSYTKKDGHSRVTEDSYKYGYNVQEQWDRAIDIDPDFIFITGWNEWMMGQFHEPWILDPDSTQLAMVDQYDREHSRDIEPDKDGYLDTYYLQMVNNIRRYKGATPRSKTSPRKTINIAGSLRQWKDVTPYYKNSKGTTIHRDWNGFAGCHYENTTGRNDIVGAKVTSDENNIYFYVECSDDITAPTEEGWMTLYIDADRSKKTGWEGYDFAINRIAPKSSKAVVEKYLPTTESGSYTWSKIGDAKIKVKGNVLMLEIPKTLLISDSITVEKNGKLEFEFKWSDNLQEKSAIDFYVNGDTAPSGRFNYLFKEN
ncbi:MAG: hypothetical protein E7384_06845 [Ruminococcaceae bacterium]|nr:hypothetical protein [Oscillospiraceae bacterium]